MDHLDKNGVLTVLVTSFRQEAPRGSMSFKLPQITVLKSVDKDTLQSIFVSLQAEIERINKKLNELEKVKSNL